MSATSNQQNALNPVRIRKRYRFSLLILALIGLIVFLSLPPREPIINGQPLSYRLGHMAFVGLQDSNIENSSAEFHSVLPAIDDRCVPALIDELNWTPSPMLRSAERLSRDWFHTRFPVQEPADRRIESALVLGWLGPRASNAIPTLEKLSRLRDPESDASESVRGAAIAALILIRHDAMQACARKSLELLDPDRNDYSDAVSFLGTNAAPCVPIFVEAIQTATNMKVKVTAVWALGAIHSRPELSLLPLKTMLKEKDVLPRYEAAAALGCFGSAAKPAWNELAACLHDPDETVRFFTTNALQKIDPTAAQQLGIGPSP